MADDTLYLKGDASSLENALDSATRNFKKYYGNIAQIVQQTGKMDASGKVLTGTITALTTANERLAVTYKKTGNQYTIIGKKVEVLSNKTREAARAEAKLAQTNAERLNINAQNRIQKSKSIAAGIDLRTQALRNERQQILATERVATSRAQARGRKTAGSDKAQIQQETAALKGKKAVELELLRITRDQVRAKAKLDQLSLRNTIAQTNAAKKAAGELLITWKSVLRLFAIRVAYSAIFNMINLFKEGVAGAQEFQRAIAGVQTINQKSVLTFNELADGLQRVSDGWRLDILEQTEAAYQALTNQVVKGHETFAFLESANRFATAAFVETNQAVRLVTAAINAYGLSAQDSERLFASFFKTIELGRIRGSELTEIGKILLPARAVGIELNELNAAIATLTRQGLKPREAFTALRGIIQALNKPTEEMTALFEDLGVETGKQAINIHGLSGLFGILEDRFQGSSAELSKLFRRIRASTGAIGLQGHALDSLKDNYDEITSSTESYNKAVDLVQNTSGEKLAIAFSKIRNVFIRLGSDFLDLASSMTDGFQDISKYGRELVNFMRTAAIPVIGVLTVAVGALGAAMLATPWGLALAAVAAATAGYHVLASSVERAAQAIQDQVTVAIRAHQDLEAERIAARTKSEETIARLEKNAFREVQKGFAERTALYTKDSKTKIEAAQAAHDVITGIAKEALKGIKSNIKETESAIKGLERQITAILKSIDNSSRSTGRTLFDWELEKLEGDAALEHMRDRVTALFREMDAASAIGDLAGVERAEQEIVALTIQARDYEKELRESNIRNQEQRAELIQKDLKAQHAYLAARNALEAKANEGEYKKREETQRKIRALDEKRLVAISEYKSALADIEIISFKSMVDYPLQLLQITKETEELKLKMAAEAAEEEAARKEELKTLRLTEDKVKVITEQLAAFKIKDILSSGLDENQLVKVAVTQQDLFDQLVAINRQHDLGLDLEGRKAAIVRLRAAIEAQLSKDNALRVQRESQRQETERRKLIQDGKNRRSSIESEVNSVKEGAVAVNTILTAVNEDGARYFDGLIASMNRFQMRNVTGRGPYQNLHGGDATIGFARDEKIADLREKVRIVAQYTHLLANLDTSDPAQVQRLLDGTTDFNIAINKLRAVALEHGNTQEVEALSKLQEQVARFRDGEGIKSAANELLEIQAGLEDLATQQLTTEQAKAEAMSEQAKWAESVYKWHQLDSQLARPTSINAPPISVTNRPMGETSNTFNINMNSSGDAGYDVDTLGKALQRKVRQGTLKLN